MTLPVCPTSLFTLYSFFLLACSGAAKPREQPFLVPPSKIMLPDPQHPPALRPQLPNDETVALAVAFQLRLPELPVLHGSVAMRRAGVPETAVDEDGESGSV
jgi:hypothetical protein